MQTLTFHTVDVFTNRPFSGNSLAIVQRADDLCDQQMQTMAREFNLPETIFIQSASNTKNTAKVRIFTPVEEIPFAGHPTIGCAIFLAEQLHATNANDDQSLEASSNANRNNGSKTDDGNDFTAEIRLEEMAGLVPVLVERKQGQVCAQFTAPVIPTPASIDDRKDGLKLDTDSVAVAIGLRISDIDTDKSPPMSHTGGPTFLFVALNNRPAVSRARVTEPTCSDLTRECGATGIYVYHLDETTNEVDARMFAPASGIPEDPATGSATALLASQLLVCNQLTEGINEFSLRQGYDMGRPSNLLLNIDVRQDSITAVKVSGSSANISSGKIRIPELE